MMFYHGGGWIGGSLRAVEDHCKGVSDQGDCVVISVAYHLAPEHPYPEGLEDSYAAVKWAVQNKQDLGIDPNKIIVSGDSAGGNFAAVLTFMAKERQEFAIAKQILIYPGTNLAEEEGSPMSKEMAKVMRALNGLYLKDISLLKDLHISPAYAPSFKDFPDALMTVGEDDFLNAGVKKYAHLLSDAGNEVKLIVYKETNHAFIDNTGNCMEADDFVREAAEFIRK